MVINRSKTYVLPYMNEYVDIKFLDRLINTYISLNNDYSFCMQYKYSGKKEFTEYERELEKNKYYRGTIDINKTEVIYVFEFPEEMFGILDIYVSGKYSYLPKREMIINFLINKFGLTTDSKSIKILKREQSLKEELEEKLNIKIPEGLDLASAPDIVNENYTYQKDDEKEYIHKN